MHTLLRRAALAGLAFFALWPGPADAPRGSCRLAFNADQFAQVIPWLIVNRRGLTFLLMR
jgi:aromatic ring-cleaving dioxygenase